MSTAVKEVKAWLSPILILVIGWLLSNKIEEIDSKFEKLFPLREQMVAVTKDIEAVNRRLEQHERMITDHTNVMGKPEEELSYEKLLGKNRK